MSRHSTPTSEFGRLGISAKSGQMSASRRPSGQQDDRRRSERLQGRAVAAGGSRSVAGSSASAGSSRKQTERPIAERASEDENESNDGSSEDEEEVTAEQAEALAKAKRRANVVMALSALDPTRVTSVDYWTAISIGGRVTEGSPWEDGSRQVWSTANKVAEYFEDESAAADLCSVLKPYGTQWARMNASSIEMNLKAELYDLPNQSDIRTTLGRIEHLFNSAFNFVMQQGIPLDRIQRTIFLHVMADIFSRIVQECNFDIQARNEPRQRPTFATGSHGKNLYQLVVQVPKHWGFYITRFERVRLHYQRETQNSIAGLWTILSNRHARELNDLRAFRAAIRSGTPPEAVSLLGFLNRFANVAGVTDV